jgi:DNA-binding transcriptional LysR family regulator
MIQLHRLEGFFWVARMEGYARAARAFPYPITQPAVHQQVKKLEGELEVVLFERVGKDRMALTPAGRHLYEFVRPFFEQLPGVLRSLQQHEYGGEISIHSAPMFLRHLLPPWIKRLHKRHAGIRINVAETVAPDIEGLRRGDADLIIDFIPSPPDDVAVMEIGTLLPFIVMPKSHRLASKSHPSLAAFSGDTFISYTPGMLPHDLQMQALARHGVRPERKLSASSAEGILGLVESGLGYSLIPWLDTKGPRGKGLAVAPLTSPRMQFPVVAAWRKDAPENPILDAALETAPRA